MFIKRHVGKSRFQFDQKRAQ